MRLPRIGRRGLAWAAVITLLSLPFILSLIPPLGASGERLKPTRLMVEAALYANQSLAELRRVLGMREPSIASPDTLAAGAWRVSHLLAEEANRTPSTGFGEAVRRALQSYALLANASAPTVLAAEPLYEGLNATAKALELLAGCRVDEALAAYSEARGWLQEARRLLLDAWANASSVDPQALLSPQHRSIAGNLTTAVSEALEAIDELERLFSIVEGNRELIGKLCSGATIPKPEALKLAKTLEGLNPERAGPLGYREAVAVEAILSKLGATPGACGGGGGQASSSGGGAGGQTGSGGGKGGGAGYRAPPSDD